MTGRVGPDVAGREDAPGHRDEVGQEVDGDQPGLAPGSSPSRAATVASSCSISATWRWPPSPYAFTLSLTSPNMQVRLGLAAGARDAALGVDHEVADEAGPGERRQGQERRGRVAARRADDRDRGVDERRQLGAMQLRQAVDGARRGGPGAGARSRTSAGSRPGSRSRKSGPRSMTAVPARRRGRGTRPAAAPWGRARKTASASGSSASMVSPVAARCGWMAADRLVVAVAAGEADDLDVRVPGEQADELGADVAGRPDDPDADPARPSSTARPRSERGVTPDERSVATAAGDSSPALTGATRPLTGRVAGLIGAPGSDGPSSWDA